MRFPFNTKMPYFSPEEKLAIEEFVATGPTEGHTYTNKGKEQRKCVRIFLPQGVITDLTVYERPNKPIPDGSRNYHTPCAKLEQHIKDAKVIWTNPKTGESGTMTGSEWMAWAGSGVKEKPKPKAKKHKLAKLAEDDPKALARISGVATGNIDNSKLDEHSQGAVWQKPTKS